MLYFYQRARDSALAKVARVARIQGAQLLARRVISTYWRHIFCREYLIEFHRAFEPGGLAEEISEQSRSTNI
jgi:hypothetical protein